LVEPSITFIKTDADNAGNYENAKNSKTISPCAIFMPLLDTNSIMSVCIENRRSDCNNPLMKPEM
jgi:hypothetical protein